MSFMRNSMPAGNRLCSPDARTRIIHVERAQADRCRSDRGGDAEGTGESQRARDDCGEVLGTAWEKYNPILTTNRIIFCKTVRTAERGYLWGETGIRLRRLRKRGKLLL